MIKVPKLLIKKNIFHPALVSIWTTMSTTIEQYRLAIGSNAGRMSGPKWSVQTGVVKVAMNSPTDTSPDPLLPWLILSLALLSPITLHLTWGLIVTTYTADISIPGFYLLKEATIHMIDVMDNITGIVRKLLLLMAGDVELNPGPDNFVEEKLVVISSTNEIRPTEWRKYLQKHFERLTRQDSRVYILGKP